MEENERKDRGGWYRPLEQEGKPEETAGKSPKKKRGWTPWRVLGVIMLAVLLIVGSSLAFGGGRMPMTALPEEAAPPGADAEPKLPSVDEMPGDRTDFFRSFYDTIERETADIRIPRAELPVDLTLELTPAGEDLGLPELYERCADSVVGISAYKDGELSYSWGTGVALSESGLILTNAHVVNDTDRAVVTLRDDAEYETELVGADITSDLAVLKIEAQGLTAAVFGESGQLRVGDPVAAIGNPLGVEFRNTLTNGIISAIERGVSYNGRTMTLLQTNTAINEGNSGGALFNMAGQVVGVTNMKMKSAFSNIEGIGFAIPSSTVRGVVNSLVLYGEVRGRPAIGITVGVIPEEAMERYELPEGLYISEVSEGSDAMAQGLREGDIILTVDGVHVTKTAELAAMKDEKQVGDTLLFVIWRDGEEMEVPVRIVDNNDVYG